MRASAFAAMLLVLASCERQQIVLFELPGGGDGGSDPGALEIQPTTAELIADGRTAGPSASFRAFARGIDVTDRAAWEVEDPHLGAIDAGVFTAIGTRGGSTAIRARLDGAVARATANVFLEVVAAAPGTPANAASLFPMESSRDDTGPMRPLIIYPANETVFPQNATRTLFQWRAPSPGPDLFELRFDSSVAAVRWYTREKSFLLDDTAREWIARTHAGRSVSVVVRGLSMTSTQAVHRSEPILLHYAESEVRGSLYYWSTGAAAIMRATLESASAEKLFPEESDKTCASCHTVSRDGRRIAFGYGGEKLRVASLPDRQTLFPARPGTPDRDYGWGSFSPDAHLLLIANKGVLSLLDLDSGGVQPVALGPGVFATHPDWSPDGRSIALVISAAPPGNKEVKSSRLARMPVLADGSFGALETIFESADHEETMAFPAWSPDSSWIAFARTRGKSKDSKPAELYLARADGSGPPILLELLDRRVGPADGVRSIADSMPTWAPSTRAELSWLAFSSIRDYGDVLVHSDRDQLWAAAIDLQRANAGLDPSAPAFWLPFQAIDEGNHRAFWSVNPEDACPSTIELCDGADNNCNGTVDEDCCTPESEVCGDGVDNDCDGAIDEGCGCGPVEICGNGVDDDCDGLVDAADEDCGL